MRGRLVACLIVTAVCVVPMAASRSMASSVNPQDRIAAGAAFTCAIKADNTVWCWGRNDQGQLGNSAHFLLTESVLPVQVAVFGSGTAATPMAVVAGAEHACVLTTTGAVWCWGRNGWGQAGVNGPTQWDPVQVVVGGTVTQLAAGGSNTCAVLADNSVRCWGQNNFGQLGTGTADVAAHYTPETVQGIPASFTVASIDIGTGHVCASSAMGEVWCWGRYTYGRLGTTVTSNAPIATRTETLSGIATDVSAGAEHSCVVVGAGLVCFGRNNFGQSGQPTSTSQFSTPTAMTINGTVLRVSAGDAFTCVTLNTGAVQCFGNNAAGQLGRGNAVSFDATPGVVLGLSSGASAISVGASHACVIESDGDVLCWGLNDFGQLGDNSQLNRNSAVAVPFFNALPPTTTVSSTTIPSSSSSPTDSSTSTSTSIATNSLTSAAVTKVVKVARNRSLTAAKIASAVSLKIPKRSQGSMRISITRGTKYCRFVGSAVRGIKKGTCTVTVVLMPKKGRPTVKTLKIQVL